MLYSLRCSIAQDFALHPQSRARTSQSKASSFPRRIQSCRHISSLVLRQNSTTFAGHHNHLSTGNVNLPPELRRRSSEFPSDRATFLRPLVRSAAHAFESDTILSPLEYFREGGRQLHVTFHKPFLFVELCPFSSFDCSLAFRQASAPLPSLPQACGPWNQSLYEDATIPHSFCTVKVSKINLVRC